MSQWISVKNYASRMEAELEKSVLEAEGIACLIESDDAGGMRPDLAMASGGVRLLVEQTNSRRASKLLMLG